MSHPFHNLSTHPSSADAAPEFAAPTPFLMYLRHRDRKPGGYFRPEAWVCFKAELRTSGFWQLLPPAEFKDWILLLSFVTPNGDCGPTLEQLAQAMGARVAEARRRMERLAALQWQGQPLLKITPQEEGRYRVHPLSQLLPFEEECSEMDSGQAPVRVPEGGSRAQVIEHSRQTYARPRLEVEREIARLNDWPEPLESVVEGVISDTTKSDTTGPQSDAEEADRETAGAESSVRRQLLRLGVATRQVEELLERHELLKIRQQLTWLGYREVRNRSGFIVAAIEGDYDPPLSVRRSLTARK